MTEDEISRYIIGAAMEVHRTLGGPGRLALVINFGERQVRCGVHRVVNDL